MAGNYGDYMFDDDYEDDLYEQQLNAAIAASMGQSAPAGGGAGSSTGWTNQYQPPPPPAHTQEQEDEYMRQKAIQDHALDRQRYMHQGPPLYWSPEVTYEDPWVPKSHYQNQYNNQLGEAWRGAIDRTIYEQIVPPPEPQPPPLTEKEQLAKALALSLEEAAAARAAAQRPATPTGPPPLTPAEEHELWARRTTNTLGTYGPTLLGGWEARGKRRLPALQHRYRLGRDEPHYSGTGPYRTGQAPVFLRPPPDTGVRPPVRPVPPPRSDYPMGGRKRRFSATHYDRPYMGRTAYWPQPDPSVRRRRLSAPAPPRGGYFPVSQRPAPIPGPYNPGPYWPAPSVRQRSASLPTRLGRYSQDGHPCKFRRTCSCGGSCQCPR